MTGVIESLERAQLRRVPNFQAGDRVKVHFQVVEGTRRRTQVFEGVVLKRQGSGVRETFTVRKQSFGVGVERTFPVHSPKIERVEVASRGDVRRAKLYYLRGRVGRRARVRERQYTGPERDVLAMEPEIEAFDAEGAQAEAEPVPEPESAGDAEGDAKDVPPDSEAKEPDAEAGTPDTEAADADASASEAPAEEPPAEEPPAAEDATPDASTPEAGEADDAGAQEP
ncbi:MAG: large subunit ribosomal protein [Solirubrobacteraceae bacterium]|nr:large subunit ribosomal protein [Solirubrobacteraceae bacterium]